MLEVYLNHCLFEKAVQIVSDGKKVGWVPNPSIMKSVIEAVSAKRPDLFIQLQKEMKLSNSLGHGQVMLDHFVR